jgi:pyruvate formate lyase activating enzyme
LVWPDQYLKAEFESEKILAWIEKNKVLLDAVVITGGEPTLHSALPGFVRKIKSLGLKVKLDTNGTNPEMLEDLFRENLVDYIAMDIKAPLELRKYRQIAGDICTREKFNNILRSKELIQGGGVDYEFRTTLNSFLVHEDLLKIIKEIEGKYFIQNIQDSGKASLTKNFKDNLSRDTLLSEQHQRIEIKFRNF